jgi:hypothetical protein
MSIVTRTQWTRQPQVPVQVLPEFAPIAVYSGGLFWNGVNPVSSHAVTSTITTEVSNVGVGTKMGSTSAALRTSGISYNHNGADPFTIEVLCSMTSTAFLHGVVQFGNANNGQTRSLLGDTGTGANVYFGGYSQDSGPTPSIAWDLDGKPHHYIMSCTSGAGGAMRWFKDGVLKGTSTSATLNNVTTTNFGIGDSFWGTIATLKVYKAALYRRCFTDAECVALGKNPWQIFAPLSRRIWAGEVAAPGTFQPAWAANANQFIGGGLYAA